MKSFAQLREQYPMFIYHRYRIEETKTHISFAYDFEIVGLSTFHPQWSIEKKYIAYFDAKDEIIQNLIFSIGLVELSSYWKLTCSPCVEIRAGALDQEQISWWKKQYFWGLGEFFYTNHIEPIMDDFMDMQSHGEPCLHLHHSRELSGQLIPIGGGKDSIVTMQLLKQERNHNKCYIINPRGASKDSIEVAGYDEHACVFVKRTLDKNMLELNKQGFLNGHTPFSALVAFSSTLFAYMNNLRYVVLSNEDSANESTIEGTNINHQYSKSFQFEKDFHEYEEKYLHSGVSYFSLLRGWSEYQIAQYFAKHEAYHHVFRSCNVGSKQDIWCCDCPKCLFVYLILCPFLSTEAQIAIFGENLLEKTSLRNTFEQLIGYQVEKPFECVGSREEINICIIERMKQMEKQGEPFPLLFRHYLQLPQYLEYKEHKNPYETYFNQEHLIPEQFLSLFQGESL